MEDLSTEKIVSFAPLAKEVRVVSDPGFIYPNNPLMYYAISAVITAIIAVVYILLRRFAPKVIVFIKQAAWYLLSALAFAIGFGVSIYSIVGGGTFAQVVFYTALCIGGFISLQLYHKTYG